ncbi:MAG: hypothetical protein AAF334_03265 [Pseudomonadota bacterium]
MRAGATISGTAHLVLVAAAVWSGDWFTKGDPIPFTVTEIELIEGQDFEAALSTAPVVPSDGPAELAQPNEGQDAPQEIEQPQDLAQAPSSAPVLPPADVPENRPDAPDIAFPPPPTDIPTEAPLPSIAEIPSPDPLNEQSTEPESPNATEPQRAVAAVVAPLPNSKPLVPPPPEPEPELAEPEPEREAATLVAEGPRPKTLRVPATQPSDQPRPDDETPQDLLSATPGAKPAEASQPDRPTPGQRMADLSVDEPEPEAADAQRPNVLSEAPETDPLQPLASLPSPTPRPRAQRPPQPEPEPAEARVPDQTTASAEPDTEPDPGPTNVRPEAPENENTTPETDRTPETPTKVAEVDPEAPTGPAPREARLPVAKPAEKAAAARAAAAQEQQRQEAARQTADADQKKPSGASEATGQNSKPAGGSTSRFAAKLTRGERNALRVGIKKYYTYGGDRSDRSLEVIIRVRLKQDGTISGKPEMRKATGGNSATQRALFQAGRRAIIRAASAGEFKRLPVDKYQRWKALNFRFTTTKIGVSS